MTRDGTRVVRAGHPAAADGEPFLPGPVFAAPFHLSGEPGEVEHGYGRYGNPTWTAFERALGEIEDAEVVLFPSGMAAVAAVLLTELRPGDTLTLPSDCYMHVRGLAAGHLTERGVLVHAVPTAELTPDTAGEGSRVLWIESPSNPGLDVCDIAELCGGEPRPAVVAVDNSFATPLGQRPLDLGADVSVTSATKHICGHADLLLGYAATRDQDLAERLRGWRTEAGAIPGPFEAWLAHRSLATLDMRLERGCANAQAVAQLLDARPDVPLVRYPGLPGDPAHEVASRQMTRFGTVVSLDLQSRARAERFLEAAALVTQATSFGGVHTTAERRARWGGDEVGEGFVRLSAGCEDTRDLLDDVARALDSAA